MILVVMAMNEEAKEILENQSSNKKVLLTGIGKVNAASKLSAFLATNQVDAIYNLGFAGASKPYHVGDIVLIEKARYHDFDLTLFGYQKGQVPGLPEAFESSRELLNHAKSVLTSFEIGQLFTGDYFMTEEKNESFIVDMEGTALYHVAHQFNIPILSIKVISDVMGMDNHFDSYKKFEREFGAQTLLRIYQSL
ncbi:MAG: 5'-methylthioadenosine/S-adenosylhomocysteine nucleosidase [Tenericutes bacterium HGW-Tenericutes-2]|jgi:adenosylhomocysteine nucleosidase|nr:MAG: 5'-methylthioadenosine/S-adenosylhomocysteine nucleosidase [Tenericutes bacterium HGW-Tenericutes-2]